jgi:tRNA pseudouridine synthase 10
LVSNALVATLPDPQEHAQRALEGCLKAAGPIEFSTFQIGIRVPAWEDVDPQVVMAWKKGIKRTVGLALEEAWPQRSVAFRCPELLLIYWLKKRRVERTIRSLYLYGRYRKLSRELPQTHARWKHQACAGKGCSDCLGTGRAYPVSLEDLLGQPAKEVLEADRYLLHGCGREDVNVRCLGRGRPFVLELTGPRRRTTDLAALASEIAVRSEGRAEIASPLRPVKHWVVGRIKEWTADKRYLARCQAESPLDPAAVASLGERLGGAVLEQRTPQRVAKRRGDKVVRRREVRSFEPGPLDATGLEFSAEITTQSGTYVKELISGDEGRTQPSVSGLLGTSLTCFELDVLEIAAEDEELVTRPPRPPTGCQATT